MSLSDVGGWLLLILVIGLPLFLISLVIAAGLGWVLRKFPPRPPGDGDFYG